MKSVPVAANEMFVINEWSVVVFEGQISLLHLHTLERIELDERGRVFVSGEVLIVCGDDTTTIRHLFSKSILEDMAQTMGFFRSKLPSSPPIVYNEEYHYWTPILPVRLRELDNGQTPNYWPERVHGHE